MVERVIRIAIDSAPAEAGGRRVVRRLEEIGRKSRQAARHLGEVESGLLRLRRAAARGGAAFAPAIPPPAGSARAAALARAGLPEGRVAPGAIPALLRDRRDGVAGRLGREGAGRLEARNPGLHESLPPYARLAPEIEAAASAQEALNRALRDGERNGRELGQGARRAFADYGAAARDAGAQVERAIGGALGGLEDVLVGFVQRGKLEWTALVDAMIADLIRLVIRWQILGPLARGLGGLPGGGDGLVGRIPGAAFTARGAAFDSGRRLAFARGGVVGRPTLFPLARGIGLMGEAGPEAILPLRRLPGGDLGVRAAGGGAVFNQTIVNEAGVEIETEERRNATGGIDQLLVLVRRDAERQMAEGRLGRVTAQRFGLSDRPVGR